VFKVVVSRRAWSDFFAIFDYIDRDNPAAASGFGAALLNQIECWQSFLISVRSSIGGKAFASFCTHRFGSTIELTTTRERLRFCTSGMRLDKSPMISD
jgi:plasmid stabilization system protein ParE